MPKPTTNNPYTVAGDPKQRTWSEFLPALQTAISIATNQPRDGEEYRHGVKLGDKVVGRAVRHTDGSITAVRFDRAGGPE